MNKVWKYRYKKQDRDEKKNVPDEKIRHTIKENFKKSEKNALNQTVSCNAGVP